jgi:ribosomal protein S13
MTNEDLKQLIAECVQEVIQEHAMDEGWGSDMWKGIKKTFTPENPDSGKSDYDRFVQMHNKRADYKKAFDPKNPGKGGAVQSKMRARAKEKVQKIKVDFENKMKKAMRDAFIEAEAVGIDRAATKKIFMSSIMAISNQYKRLEEEKTTNRDHDMNENSSVESDIEAQKNMYRNFEIDYSKGVTFSNNLLALYGVGKRGPVWLTSFEDRGGEPMSKEEIIATLNKVGLGKLSSEIPSDYESGEGFKGTHA